jgi:excisionase family DNA binding protein
MRNLRRFSVSEYNFQLGFYPQPYWLVPELEVYSSIQTNSHGQFNSKQLLDAFISCQKMAVFKLKKLENEKLDHPEPLRIFHKTTPPQDEMLSIKDIAKVLKISQSAARTLVDNKILRSTKTNGGHRRVPIIEILKYKKTLTDAFKPSSPTLTTKNNEINFVRISQASEILKIHPTTLWRKYKKGLINGHSFGKEIRFLESEIQNQIEEKS